MTLQELINAVILKATGKPTILASNNTKWEKVRGIANFYQQAWAHEPGQHWRSLYNLESLGTITSDNSMYQIPYYVDEVSTAFGDNIYVWTTDGKRVEFELVDHDDFEQHLTGNYCTIIGHEEADGEFVVFNRSFAEGDPCYGGELFVPVYYKLGDLVNADDVVFVDDPYWLVTMCAAEYIRNDIVKQNQYGNLIAEANNLMNGMIRRNRAGQVRHIRGSFHNGGGLNYD